MNGRTVGTEAPELGTPCYKGQNVDPTGLRYRGVPL